MFGSLLARKRLLLQLAFPLLGVQAQSTVRAALAVARTIITLLLAAAVATAAIVHTLTGVGLPKFRYDPLDVFQRDSVLSFEPFDELGPQLRTNLGNELVSVAAVLAATVIAAEVTVLEAVAVLVLAPVTVAAYDVALGLCLRLRRKRRQVVVQ